MIKKVFKKNMIYNIIKKIEFLLLPLYFSIKKNYYTESKEPIFLISSNRSGSSLIASILRQHPSLRSLSNEVLDDKVSLNKSHTLGFAEDYIWQFLEDYTSDHFRGKNEGFLWSHPKYISNIYKDDFFLKKSLIYEIYKIKSNKIPLVKHPFFSLRLKLIKKIFPKAKIIFNIRSYKDYIKSNIHKWSDDENFQEWREAFKKDDPDIGLHWHMINSVALYHLKKYFKNQNYVVFHEKLYDPGIDNQMLMDEITDFLGVDKFKFSFHNVDKKYKFNKEIDFEYNKLKDITEIANYENEIYKKFRKK